jgi:uncharacterized protein YjbI with pentapeptide repeats
MAQQGAVERPDHRVPPDRCAFVFDTASEPTGESLTCCWRQTWKNSERCIWHTDADKTGVITERTFLDEENDSLVASVFRGASLRGSAVLHGRQFVGSDFSGVDLRHADLRGADFRETDFAGADLRYADLTGADLRNADFSGADLRDTNLTDVNARWASFEGANMENAALTRTNLRGANIVDARLYEVSLSDTLINETTQMGERCIYEKEEVEDWGDRNRENIHRHSAAAWTYRALQLLCHHNALPTRSRHYYVREKEARRKNAWETGNYGVALRYEASRWVMEYGSNAWRIVGISMGVILLFAFLYPISGTLLDTAANKSIGWWINEPTDIKNPLLFLTTVYLRSLYFSIITFATLGFGDIQPIGPWTRALAAVETLIGSLLIALLVFVLSRSATW